MKILFIGGTGNISAACVRRTLQAGHEVSILNRGNRPLEEYGIKGALSILADIQDEKAAAKALGDASFDVVANFIAFTAADVERDIRLFNGRCGQYIFISSASAYQKPLVNPVITESTPLENPYWDYSRHKIECERACMKACGEQDFPVTIVRPSLTYETVIPMAIGGWNDYGIVSRIRQGKPVVVHGDGSNLWTITHSKDFAKGFAGLLGNPGARGEAFHITSDELLTWNQIYDALGIAAGVGPVEKIHIPSDFIIKLFPRMEGSLLGDKAVSAVFDNSKIKKFVPDFEVTVSFQEGIKQTLSWFEEKPERMKIQPQNDHMIDALIQAYRPVFDALKPL